MRATLTIDEILNLEDDTLFRSPQVCRMVGVTYRQIDYWARVGVVEPSRPARGSGSQRLYSKHDVARLWLVKTLASIRDAATFTDSEIPGTVGIVLALAADLEDGYSKIMAQDSHLGSVRRGSAEDAQKGLLAV